MQVRLVRYGREYVLGIDQSLLDELEITEDTLLEITAEDGKLIIQPAEDQIDDVEFQAALEETNRKYARALQRLADS